MNIQTIGANATQGDLVTPEQEAAFELRKAMEVLTIAKAVQVTTDDEYAQADAAVAAIKNAQKAAEAKRTSLVKPLNDTVKRINAEFKPVDAAFEEALGYYRRPMSAYQAELARIRAKAEAEAKAERDRLAAEAAAELAAAQKAAEEAAAAQKAAETVEDPFLALLAEDSAAEAKAAAEAQAEAAKDALRSTAMIQAQETPKVTGSASKTHTVWKYEITDPALVPLRYRPIDESAIARDVRALKGETEIPGVRVYSIIEVR